MLTTTKIEISVSDDVVVATHGENSWKWKKFHYFKTREVLNCFQKQQETTLENFKSQNVLFSFLDRDALVKEYRAHLVKSRYINFKKTYGISASTVRKILNSKMKEIWVVDQNLFNKFCFCSNKRRPSPNKVHRLKKLLSLLKEVKNKSNLPLVFYLGVSESELPSFFGEDLWTDISKNSEYRNNVLCRKIINIGEDGLLFKYNCDDTRVLFKKINKIKKTGAIESFYYDDFNLLYIFSKIFKIKELKKINKFFLGAFGYSSDPNVQLANKIRQLANKIRNEVSKISNSNCDLNNCLNWTKEQWENKFKLQ
jgi:hypothetical protein